MKRNQAEEEIRSSGAVGRVSLITLLSRILGLVREQIKAFFLGTSASADAFNVGFMLPNLLRRFLAEGIISAAVVPVLTEYLKEEGKREVKRFVSLLLGSLILLLTLIVSAGVFLAPYYIPLFFPEFGPHKAYVTVLLTTIMFPYIGFVSLAALFQGVLNCHGRFGLPALCPVVLNVCIISGMWLFAPQGADEATRAQAARIMALGVLAGGAVQAALLIPALLRLGYSLFPRLSLVHRGVRRVGALLVPVVVGGGVHQLNVVVSLILAAQVPGDGRVSALQYSNRLLELALGVFVVSVLTVALPGLSRLWDGDKNRFFRQAAFALDLILLISIPAGAGLFFLRHEIISVVFYGGNFTEKSLALTETALFFHAWSVPLTAGCRFFAQAFYAARNSKTPLRIGTAMAVTNILLCLLLLKPLEHGGIAFAATLSAGTGFLLYLITWFKRNGKGSLPGVLSVALPTLAAGLLMGLFHKFWTSHLIPFPEESSRLIKAVHVAASIAVDSAFFFASAWLLGIRDMKEFLGVLAKRRKK